MDDTAQKPRAGRENGTARTASYRDLEVWQNAMLLAECCYRITSGCPTQEVFGLATQIRRAAVSIPSNIAEGQSRRMTGAYVQHLSIAAGSHAELETQIELSRRLGLVSKEAAESVSVQLTAVGRMLTAMIRALRRKHAQALSAGRPNDAPGSGAWCRCPDPRSQIPDPRS